MPDCPQKTICDDLRNRGYRDDEFGCKCSSPEDIDDFLDSIDEEMMDILDHELDEQELDRFAEKLADRLREKLGPVTPADYKKIARSVINIIEEEAKKEMEKFWGDEVPERPTEEELEGIEGEADKTTP